MSDTIKKLLQGNQQFREKFFQPRSAVFEQLLREGQRPKVMVIACADARIDPAMIFNCQPGELFVVRNIANLVPPCEEQDTYHGTSAALEFGVCFLQVEQVIVLGHTQCGGIQALLQNPTQLLNKVSHGFIAKWLELAQPAYLRVQSEWATADLATQATVCERYSLVNSLNNLHSFPWIQERIARQQLALHAWHFDLATGSIWRYESQSESWHNS